MSSDRSYAVEPTNARALRQEVLMPFLERVCLGDGEVSTPTLPEEFSFTAELLELEEWERETLENALRELADPMDPSLDESGSADVLYLQLMAEGVAFQAKCFTQFQRWEAANAVEAPEHKQGLIQEFTTDAAVGLALMTELQRDINQLISSGGMEPARHLTSFRNKVGRNVIRIREQIGQSAYESAEQLAESYVEPIDLPKQGDGSVKEVPEWARSPEHKKSAERAKNAARRKGKKKKKVKSRALPLAVVLTVLLVAWGVVVLPSMMQPEPVVLQTADFASVKVVTKITARPPSLFVDVDSDLWGDLSPAVQDETVREIGNIAQQAGYIGAQIRNSEGKTVANWTENGGIRMVTPSTD